jgi:ribosomal protein S8
MKNIKQCLISLRNGITRHLSSVFLPFSNEVFNLCFVLEKEGFIKSFYVQGSRIKVLLR